MAEGVANDENVEVDTIDNEVTNLRALVTKNNQEDNKILQNQDHSSHGSTGSEDNDDDEGRLYISLFRTVI